MLFARFGYHQYYKVNADVDSMLFLRQKNDIWYKFDYIFSWEDHMISVFINNKLNTTQPFHMGQDPFAMGQGKQVTFTGADTMVLYTLSPGGKSEFMDVKLCLDKCIGYDTLIDEAALNGISSSSKLLVATLLIYLSMLQEDSTEENKI